ncbi:unnamed protein product [Caenorhabditis brenneri]
MADKQTSTVLINMRMSLFTKVCFVLLIGSFIPIRAATCLTCVLQNSCNKEEPFINCERCQELMDVSNSDVKTFIFLSNSIAKRMCRFSPDVDNCLSNVDTVMAFLIGMGDQLFPSNPEEGDKTLTCSHLLKFCPDRDKNGNEIGEAWSCPSCHSFMNHLSTMLTIPLPFLNKAITETLCPKGDKSCVDSFTNVITLTGEIGKFIAKEPGTETEDVCNKMGCIP